MSKSVEFDDVDESGILYSVERNKDGSFTASVRVCGGLTIDGQSYSYDRHVKVRLKKEK